MIYQIDQSGKLEDTNRLTIVAYAGDHIKSLKISAVEKQKLMRVMKALDYPKRNYVYKAFAALIFLLSSELEPTDSLVIDKEYPGHEESIKGILINLFRRQKRTAPVIRFDNVGKTSPAHKAALDVFRGNSEADLIVSAKDVLGLLY